uniref:PDZ domain-containing protein n=1 Tax=Lepeophtheirus salmonis TaxID=72036 RepID=A0A0K2SWC5_LEPSM
MEHDDFFQVLPSVTYQLSHSTFFLYSSEGQTFVVHKDTNGYGLTLFGYRPVFVQTVKAKGAADRAGIKERDIILQVNGINVTESSHDEVVDIIKGLSAFL